MEQLYIKCSNCGNDFLCPIQMDRGSFEESSNTVTDMQTNCPQCNFVGTFNKDDFFFGEK